jgi:hypothetical protein
MAGILQVLGNANTLDKRANVLFTRNVLLSAENTQTLIVSLTTQRMHIASCILGIIKSLTNIVVVALNTGISAFQKVDQKAKFFASLLLFYLLECRSKFSQVKN